MKIIGLAGRAGCGKDTIADYLVEKYGFLKFSFSDALYDEVQKAYDLWDQSLLRDRETKDTPTPRLARWACSDLEFDKLLQRHGELTDKPLSPRKILQLWGTEYRRTQDPDYWLKKAALFVDASREYKVPGIVNTSVRYPNEQKFIHELDGTIWHVHRKDLPPMDNAGHSSEIPLPFVFGRDKELHNNSTIARLRTGVSLLYGYGGNRVIIEDQLITERARDE